MTLQTAAPRLVDHPLAWRILASPCLAPVSAVFLNVVIPPGFRGANRSCNPPSHCARCGTQLRLGSNNAGLPLNHWHAAARVAAPIGQRPIPFGLSN